MHQEPLWVGNSAVNEYIFLITKLNPEDGGSTASETSVSNHNYTAQQPKIHDFSGSFC